MSSAAADRLDRRGPKRGDERRTALLAALEEMLKEGVGLEDVQIAEISRRAGVTRSAFYFYFESKAIAVAALMDQHYAESAAAGEILLDVSRDPAERIEAALRALLASVGDRLPLYLAMLTARGPNPVVTELWESDRASFVPAVAAMIRDERSGGRAVDGPDAEALATALLDLNDRAMESHARAGAHTTDERIAALVAIWVRSIYGS
ncbi:TetR/AcrR family transcriptional regulator [Nocardioides alcanivorans]|uniref:TetR/AcrR family transcriptional regulator n=1 Tax=Nocardioides alcanivorans TaxID=2897352 RepID=UPI001F1DD12D|nr:TetR/AcrR family transcriptional regulator [Nocardioides alcanivorans]